MTHYVNNDTMLLQRDLKPPTPGKQIPQETSPGSNISVWRANAAGDEVCKTEKEFGKFTLVVISVSMIAGFVVGLWAAWGDK